MTSQVSDKPARQSMGYVYMAFSATGVIFLPTTAKFALESGSDVLSVAFARGIVATLILLAIALLLGLNLRLPQRQLWPSAIVGIAAAAFVYGMYQAILSINISLALLILFLYPMAIATFEHLSGSNRLRAGQWLWGFSACTGLILILGVRFESIAIAGVFWALLAMLATVVLTLQNVKVVEAAGSLVANFYMSLWTLLIFAVGLALSGSVAPPQNPIGWAGMLGNGVAYCVSWVAFFSGARILGATRASMITLLEPPLAAFTAWLIFSETFSLPQWGGFTLVLFSLFMFEKSARTA